MMSVPTLSTSSTSRTSSCSSSQRWVDAADADDKQPPPTRRPDPLSTPSPALALALAQVYGDAEDEEHIKLVRVLETILKFSPEERAKVREKIDYYEASWWHRTANLLKPTAAYEGASASGAAPGTANGASASAAATAPAAAPVGGDGSWWSSVFGVGYG